MNYNENSKMESKEFCQNARRECNEFPIKFDLEFQSTYHHYIRRFSLNLGGLLIGIIEQGIILKRDQILGILERENWKINSTVKVEQMDDFMKLLKKLKEAKTFDEKQKLLFSDLKRDDITISAEKLAREILLKSKKFVQEEFYLKKIPSPTNSSYLFRQSSIIKFFCDMLQIDVVLFQIDKQSKELYYNNYKATSKSLTLVIYLLNSGFYACYLKSPHVINLGDGFPSEMQLKERNNRPVSRGGLQQTSKINGADIGSPSNGIRAENNYIQDKLDKCNSCQNTFESEQLYSNQGCKHVYCVDCLSKELKKNSQNDKFYCIKCQNKLVTSQAVQFIEKQNANKNKLTKPSGSTSVNCNLSASLNENSKNSETLKERCTKCNIMTISSEGFKLYPTCHMYCYDCMKKMFLIQGYQEIYCLSCRKVLQKEAVNNFLTQKKQINQELSSNNQSTLSSSQKMENSSSANKKKQDPPSSYADCCRCFGKFPSDSLIYPATCKHGQCEKCFIAFKENMIKFKEDIKTCYNCNAKISRQNVDSIQIKQSNSVISTDNKDKSLSTSYSTNYKEPQKSKNQCSLCYSNSSKHLYLVEQCGHQYCLTCIQQKIEGANTNYCFVKGCRTKIDLDQIDEFYSIKIIDHSDQQLNSHQVICAQCKRGDKILASTAPDYFKCQECFKTTCVKHNQLVSNCKCFCEKCGSQIKKEGNLLSCLKCNSSTCKICKSSECKCPCEFCKKKKVGKLCECLQNTCSCCLDELQNIQLNDQNDTLLRKHTTCSHSFCNACYYQKILNQDPSLQCLFCE